MRAANERATKNAWTRAARADDAVASKGRVVSCRWVALLAPVCCRCFVVEEVYVARRTCTEPLIDHVVPCGECGLCVPHGRVSERSDVTSIRYFSRLASRRSRVGRASAERSRGSSAHLSGAHPASDRTNHDDETRQIRLAQLMGASLHGIYTWTKSSCGS